MIVISTWIANLARILRGVGVPIGCITAISASACEEFPSTSRSERVDSGAPASPASAGSSVRKRALRQVPSLVRLIANPEKYDAQEVTVSGYLLLHNREYGEDGFLYLHWDDARWLLMNGVGVFFGACEGSGEVGPSIVEPDDALEYNNSYVTVTGTFQADLVYGLGDRLCSVTTIQAHSMPLPLVGDASSSGRDRGRVDAGK